MPHTPPSNADSKHLRMSFRTKLTIAAALLVIVTATISDWIGFRFARQSLTDQIHSRLEAIAYDREKRIDAHVASLKKEAALISSRTRLRQLLSDRVVTGPSPEFVPSTRKILEDAQQSNKAILSISITDTDGKVVTSTNANQLGIDFADSESFHQGLLGSHLSVPEKEKNRFTAVVSVPTYSRERNLLGVIMVKFDMQSLHDIVSDTTGLGETGELLAAKQEGDKLVLLFPSPKTNASSIPLGTAPTLERVIRNQEPGYGISTYDGESILIAWRPINYQSADYQPWGMAVKIFEVEAYRPIAHLYWMQCLTTFALVAIGLGAAFVLARQFTSPITDMVAIATQVGQGDFSARMSIPSTDEFGQLAGAFNDMTDKLVSAQAALHRRVKERTLDLESAMRAALESEARFRNLADSAPALIWITESDKACSWLNRRWLDYTGASLEDQVGMGWMSIVHDDDKENTKLVYTAACEQQTSFGLDYRLRRQDGEYRWHRVIAHPRFDEQNNFLGFVGLSLDDHDARQSRLELKRRTEELDTANQSLQQSNVDLLQFAYVASHDLKTPLRGIAGFAHFLAEDYQDQLDAQANDYIDRIITGVKRMQQLIDDLLAYARVDSREEETVPVDLNLVFQDACTLLQADIVESNAEITNDPLPTILGEKSQLTQLLQNLVGNGIKYRTDTPPRIHVGLQQTESGSRLYVSDNGIGIAAEHQDEVFEIFRRLHSPQSYSGTGIGLAVCRRIVNRHGGKIWLQSVVGEGTTFFVSLPDKCLPLVTTELNPQIANVECVGI